MNHQTAIGQTHCRSEALPVAVAAKPRGKQLFKLVKSRYPSQKAVSRGYWPTDDANATRYYRTITTHERNLTATVNWRMARRIRFKIIFQRSEQQGSLPNYYIWESLNSGFD